VTTTKAGHTKGPWKVSPEDWSIYNIENGPRDTKIASLRYLDNVEANARLIAAAPDLLEACKKALTVPEYNLGIGVVEALKAAIKKAEVK